MAVIKAGILGSRLFGGSEKSSGRADSKQARKAVHEAYKKSGGPTAELRRVYGEYLAYARAKRSNRED